MDIGKPGWSAQVESSLQDLDRFVELEEIDFNGQIW